MATFYCNFATGNDTTGDGSSGNPYKTIQKALTTAGTTAATNVVYVMADEPLSATLSFPASNREWIITGALAATRPTISYAGGAICSSPPYVTWHRLKFYVAGANIAFGLNNQLFNCDLELVGRMATGTTGTTIVQSYIHGTGSTYGYSSTGGVMSKCIVDVSGVGVAAVTAPEVSDSLLIMRDSNRRGISGNGIRVKRATVVAPSGSTGDGVFVGDIRGGLVSGCIIVGFAVGVTGNSACSVFRNSFWNCTTNIASAGIENDNESLASTPFRDASSNDFTPLNVGSALSGDWPDWLTFPIDTGRPRGAVTPEATAGVASGGFPLSRLVN